MVSRVSFLSLLSLAIIAVPLNACEGECIVQITNVFVGNYSAPVEQAFADVAAHIAQSILPSRSLSVASSLVKLLHDAYKRDAYNIMEEAIFPGYFHGKCQVNGVDPPGCPDPDCPVVCGTPGSMVHFYDILKQIAFNATSSDLERICLTSSKSYRSFESAVLHAVHTRAPQPRALSLAPQRVRSFPDIHMRGPVLFRGEMLKRRSMSDKAIKAHLNLLCKGMTKVLERRCGGNVELSNCSWETAMKEFILSFP